MLTMEKTADYVKRWVAAFESKDLDRVLWEVYGSDFARDAVRQKVAALFPAHEIDAFTQHFWDLIQRWRADTQRELEPTR